MVDRGTEVLSRPAITFPHTPGPESSATLIKSTMPGRSGLMPQPSPTRSSPRKLNTSTRHLLPTPLSLSPTADSYRQPRLPPSFDPHSTSSRYPVAHPSYSPYRPGEYSRSDYAKSEREVPSERTKIERKLFDGDRDEDEDGVDGIMSTPTKRPGREEPASSPLDAAFEPKMVLRNGASVDLISWLRKNFYHIPESQHNSLTPPISLIGIRALLLERFPRVPELGELSKAVLAAFPRSKWETSHGAFSNSEPPILRGLMWHGKDVVDENEGEDEDMEDVPREGLKERERPNPQIVTRARASLQGQVPNEGANGHDLSASRSPTQSALVSPISSSAKRPPPGTPARSVLEEFAEIATLNGKTPRSKPASLPDDAKEAFELNGSALALANITGTFDQTESRKRMPSQSPEMLRCRSQTPDKISGLLAAAEAVEGSPMASFLGHKRRRTIGGPAPSNDMFGHHSRRQRKGIPTFALGDHFEASRFLPPPHMPSPSDSFSQEFVVPLNDTASAISLGDLDSASMISMYTPLGPPPPGLHAGSSSSASQSSNVSNQIPSSSMSGSTSANGSYGRKGNELPTQGDQPGVDCKPPHPYHEMIRYAIESAPDQRLQLSHIYTSIADRFPFFKTLDEKKTAGWQNSIRHNLSLKKMFVRVNKVDGIPDDNNGKGGWWTVQPGVHDEGRPGRKAKAKKRSSDGSQSRNGDDDVSWDGERESSIISRGSSLRQGSVKGRTTGFQSR